MKIAFCYRYLILGGVTTQLVNRLKSLVHRVQPTFVYTQDCGGLPTFAGFPGVRILQKPAEQSAFFSQTKFDVVVVIDTPELFAPILDAGYHGVLINEVHTTTTNLKYLHELRANQRVLAALDALITPSRYLADRIQNDYGFAKVKPVHIVPNCLDLQHFRFDRRVEAPPKPILLWVGKLDDHKNWQDFLKLTARVAKDRPNVEAWIAGGQTAPEPRAKELYTLISELKLTRQVRWLCQVDYAHMARLYSLVSRSGGCLVITSSNESFGMTVAEARACHCPVVATNVGAIPEQVEHGRNGFLFKLHRVNEGARLVSQLLSDTALRRRFIRAGAQHTRTHCGIDQVCEQYVALLTAMRRNKQRTPRPPQPRASAAASPTPAAAGPSRSADKADYVLQQVAQRAPGLLPPGARTLIISKGDPRLLSLPGAQAQHFPQTKDGVYAGYHPADSAEAIRHLEELRGRGAQYLLIPATSFWWLDHYSELRRHLESSYRMTYYQEGAFALYCLDGPSNPDTFQLGWQLRSPEAADSPDGRDAPHGRSPGSLKQTPPPITTASRDIPVSSPLVETPGEIRTPPHRAEVNRSLTVGCILDEFSAACFEPEARLIALQPDSWQKQLDGSNIDLLFVESAWHGNQNAWEHLLPTSDGSVNSTFAHLVRHCRSHGIPTVFWNKEDPVHFDRFIEAASLFDFVCTTDAEVLPSYRRRLKHNRLHALPFAAQPRIHHPVLHGDRPYTVAFAGTYYAADYPERRSQMRHVLGPALPFGLHIYDRQSGLPNLPKGAYEFPEPFRSAIMGRLEYREMIRAYRLYKVFLNVNSVNKSRTMLSRRVFELLACGTPVISSPARALSHLFGPGIVSVTHSAQETTAHLTRLVEDETHWSQVSLQGLRRTLAGHTYAHRLAEICRHTGLAFRPLTSPGIEVAAVLRSQRDCERLAHALRSQTLQPEAVAVLAGSRLAGSLARQVGASLPALKLRVFRSPSQLVAHLTSPETLPYIWFQVADDFYGPDFLRDATALFPWNTVDVVGKRTHFELPPQETTPRLVQPGHEFRQSNSLSPGTVVARRQRLSTENWCALLEGGPAELRNCQSLSLDRWNYIRHGARAIPNNPTRLPKSFRSVCV